MTTKTNKESIHKVQKIVLAIEGVPPRTHSTSLFYKQNVLTFEKILYTKRARIIYDNVKSNLAAFHDSYSQHTYSFGRITHCSERIRSNYGTKKLTHMIPQLLTAHPTIRNIVEERRSVVSFKKIHIHLCFKSKVCCFSEHKIHF